ncbi:MAG: cell filamentation protein Fic [Nitrospirae bacterium]|nr:cell filamentation protein Fic [Nitrospirota bacterium]
MKGNAGFKAAGYSFLIRNLGLEVVTHYRDSLIASKGQRKTRVTDGHEEHIYPTQYDPGLDPMNNLIFAIKYDGINLNILKAAFKTLGPDVVTRYIKGHPVGRYARMIWYLYEFLTEERLSIPDASVGNYVILLDGDRYYTGLPVNSRRHRVTDNLLGGPDFCPVVRKTEVLARSTSRDLKSLAAGIVSKYPENVIRRATQYLYTKETRTSFEIERENPDLKRMTRFIEYLRRARLYDRIDKALLLDVQNSVVDERFAATDYRSTQNYVGRGLGMRTSVDYVSPIPSDIPALMEGLLASNKKMHGVDSVVHAAVIAFGFVYLHPFDDGNGRVHRYLIHHILASEGVTPEGLIFPVSATMLSDMPSYDRCMETFSRLILPLIDFRLNEDGEVEVLNNTGDLYRYMDMTAAAEYLYAVTEKTIQSEFVDEIDFLSSCEVALKQMSNEVDMSDRLIRTFIQCVIDNGGKLSKAKRKLFDMLTDQEIATLEEIVRKNFLRQDESQAPSEISLG